MALLFLSCFLCSLDCAQTGEGKIESENCHRSGTVEATVFIDVREEKSWETHAKSVQILEGNIMKRKQTLMFPAGLSYKHWKED
jgi:hypothetical protein